MKEKLLQFLLENLKDVKAFTISEAPSFIRELLNYKYNVSLVYMIISVVFIILITSLIIYIIKKDYMDLFAALFIWAVLSVAPIAILDYGVSNLYKIKYAPKVYILEYFNDKYLKDCKK